MKSENEDSELVLVMAIVLIAIVLLGGCMATSFKQRLDALEKAGAQMESK